MGCAPTVSTMNSSALSRRQNTLLDARRQKDLDYNDEGRGPVPGVINTGLDVRGGWYRCTAEITGTHCLHAERSE